MFQTCNREELESRELRVCAKLFCESDDSVRVEGGETLLAGKSST